MAEAAADEGRAANLPEQPAERFRAGGSVSGQELAELFRHMHQNRATFEHADRG